MRSRRLEYFLIGLFCGGVFGLMSGLLLAPSSGAKTRRRVAIEARRFAEAARIVAEQAEHTADILGERVDHYLGRDEEIAWRKVREIREGVQRYAQT
jgi:gas vesicle protein